MDQSQNGALPPTPPIVEPIQPPIQTTNPIKPASKNHSLLIISLLFTLSVIIIVGVIVYFQTKSKPVVVTNASTPTANIPPVAILPIPPTESTASGAISRPIDGQWSQYTNYDLGISFKFPKEVLIQNCEAKNISIPVVAFQEGNSIYLGPTEFPDRSSDGVACNMADLDLPTFKSRLSQDFSKPDTKPIPPGYKIQVFTANNLAALEDFAKKKYSVGCIVKNIVSNASGIQEFSVSPRDGNYESCMVNFAHKFLYSPETHKAAFWEIGQEPQFNGEGFAYDDDIAKSFTFALKP